MASALGMTKRSLSESEVSSQSNGSNQLAGLWSAASPALTVFVRTMVRDSHDVDDIIQQTGEYVSREFHGFEPGTSFTGWVITVAKIRIQRLWQDRSRDRLVLNPEALDMLADAAATMGQEIPVRQAAMRICVEKLQPCHQELLEMHYSNSQRPAQIAEQLGRTANAVSASLMRIRRTLKQCIEAQLSHNKGDDS